MVDMTDEAFEVVDVGEEFKAEGTPVRNLTSTEQAWLLLQESGFWDRAPTARVPARVVERLRARCR